MAILDGNLQFSSSQAISAAGTTTSTNIVNFGSVADLGITERPLEVLAAWTTVPVGSSPGTTTIQGIYQASATGTSAWTSLVTGPAYTDTQWAALIAANGVVELFDIPPGAQQYGQIVWNVASGSLTAGAVTANIVLDVGTPKYYPRGYTA